MSQIQGGLGGEFRLPRRLLTDAPEAEARRVLSALLLCAAGGERPPRGEATVRLLARIASDEDFQATLVGARAEARGADLLICREAGEFDRAGAPDVVVPLGESVFDGRFAITCRVAGLRVRPAVGLAAQLDRDAQARLAALPPSVRRGMPAALAEGRAPLLPPPSGDGPILARPITRERLWAALGAYPDEASFWRVENLRRRS